MEDLKIHHLVSPGPFSSRPLPRLFAYVESLAGFEERFHAGKHTWPTPRNLARHGRTSLEVPVRYRQAHHVFNCFDFKCDTRFIRKVVRVSPAQHKAFGWRAFQNFAGD